MHKFKKIIQKIIDSNTIYLMGPTFLSLQKLKVNYTLTPIMYFLYEFSRLHDDDDGRWVV